MTPLRGVRGPGSQSAQARRASLRPRWAFAYPWPPPGPHGGERSGQPGENSAAERPVVAVLFAPSGPCLAPSRSARPTPSLSIGAHPLTHPGPFLCLFSTSLNRILAVPPQPGEDLSIRPECEAELSLAAGDDNSTLGEIEAQRVPPSRSAVPGGSPVHAPRVLRIRSVEPPLPHRLAPLARCSFGGRLVHSRRRDACPRGGGALDRVAPGGDRPSTVSVMGSPRGPRVCSGGDRLVTLGTPGSLAMPWAPRIRVTW